jgi:hypothetical protein
LSFREVAFCLSWGLGGPAWATADAAAPPPQVREAEWAPAPGAIDSAAPRFDFDIPAQALHAALSRYADISGQPALFPSDIADARTSTAVRGRLTAEAALRRLLQDTGLVADKRSSALGQTFVLKEAGAPRGGRAALFGDEGYAGLLQSRVWQALCANARTRPGAYDTLLRFELDANGRVGSTQLIGGSGDAQRDAALLRTVDGVRLDRPPPAAIVRQPLTLAIRRDEAGTGPQCGPRRGGG